MKQRLDVYLFERGFCPSREKAKALIMAGSVFVGGQRVDKPGFQVADDAEIELRGQRPAYVSRGGLKLEKAIKEFDVSLAEKICADIGASTGGFTDCMLKNGAKKVYAVDVGYGQLAWELRQDPRVVVLERQNARYLTQKEIPEPLNFFSVDVSFISLKLILPAVKPLCAFDAEAVLLIKPQFECGKGLVGKNGVVKDPKVHKQVVEQVVGYCRDSSFFIKGLSFSPIKGPEGNIEYLIYISNCASDHLEPDIERVVSLSHESLKGD